MDATAARVFSQIGFPRRRSLFGALLARGVPWPVSGAAAAQVKMELFPESARRLLQAVDTLFAVLPALHAAQPATSPPPLLLLDEVHDLVRDGPRGRLHGLDSRGHRRRGGVHRDCFKPAAR